MHASLQTLSYRIRPRLKPGFGRRMLGRWLQSASGSSNLFRDLSENSHDKIDEQAASDAAEDIAEDDVPQDATAPALGTDGEDAPK